MNQKLNDIDWVAGQIEDNEKDSLLNSLFEKIKPPNNQIVKRLISTRGGNR